jgi:hypothetical protein
MKFTKRHLRRTATLLALAAAGIVLLGCGGENDPEFTSQSAPAATEFPSVKGKTLDDLAADAKPTRSIVVSPAGMVFNRGENRFGFGVFKVSGEGLPDSQVALYAAPRGGGELRGPFPARIENLQTEPAFRSKNVALDPDTAKVVYVADVDFPDEGKWDMAAVVRDGDELRSTLLPTVTVGGGEQVPAVGERPPPIHTPTADEVGGDLASIDTRSPHDSMHEDDFADVVGKKPVVLLFATPALCQSRVCGPVVDEAEAAKAEFGDQVSFIHMEVYKNNNASDGLRSQLREFGLPTEPWLFVIDGNGKVSTRIEGAFGISELDAAIRKVVG